MSLEKEKIEEAIKEISKLDERRLQELMVLTVVNIGGTLERISTQLEELNKRGATEQQLTENIGKLADRLQEYIEHKWHSVT